MRESRARRSGPTRFVAPATRDRSSSQGVSPAFLSRAALIVILTFTPCGRSAASTAPRPAPPVRTAQQSSPQDADPPLAPVEREMKGGESHAYRINCAAGQFLHALVEQKGIDVEVSLFSPDGRQLSAADSPNDIWGPEPIVVLAEATGDYRVVVSAPNPKAAPGRYEIKPYVLRESTDADRRHAAAEKLFGEARRLRAGQTAAERRAAVEKYEQAIPLYRAAGETYREALSRLSIGIAYARLDEPRTALEHFGQALTLARSLEDRRLEAGVETFLGGMSDILGEPGGALRHYGRALSLSKENGNVFAEATTLLSIGVVYFNLADWQKAVDYGTQSLAPLRALGSRQQEALALRNIGLAYNMLGEPQEGLRHLEESLRLCRAVGDRNGESVALSNSGNSYYRMGDYAQALDLFNRALEIQRAVGNRGREADTLDRIGLAYTAEGQPGKALEYHQQALPLQHAAGNLRSEAMSLRNLGSAYYLLGQPEMALEHFHRALPMFQGVSDLNSVGLTLEGIARAERALGNFQAAHVHAEEAIATVEQVRARVTSGQTRAAYLATRHDAYRFLIELLMELHRRKPAVGHNSAALEVSERARARSLLELLNEAGVDIRQGVDPGLTARERELSQMLAAKAQRLTQRNTPEQLAALKKEIDQLEVEYERAQGDIRKDSPRYAALVQPQPLKLKEIQSQLDADTLLLEYALGSERSYLWAITRDSLTSYELPKGELIEKDARRVYELLTARSTRGRGETARQRQERISQAEAKLPAAAQALSQTLLAPVAAELGNRRLVIVADGALQYIPFAMLPDPSVVRRLPVAKNNGQRTTDDTPPLIVRHEVVSLPSASALAIQRAELAGRRPAPKLLAVIADPVFDRTDERFKTAAPEASDNAQTRTIALDDARSIEHLAGKADDKAGAEARTLVIPRLPFTRQEATRLLALAPRSASFSAIDFHASRATVLGGDLGQYRYVHFATHGLLDAERPGLSSLVLSTVDAEGRPQDGFLRANDIYNLRLPAELVVLSACQTGLGKEIKGEGLVGLTRGFMYAGAARVVVSLWNVNDRATAELMAKFYERMLKQGNRPAAALRAAQVEMWRQRQWQSPYYWAAFTMQGEWR